MAKKWAYLKGQFPTLPADPSYGEGLQAQVDEYRTLTPALVFEEYNDLEEELTEREQEVKALLLKKAAAERVIADHMDTAGYDSIEAAGHKWTTKIEPYPQTKDKAALRAWADANMSDNLTLPFQTLRSVVKDALESGEPLPPGIDVYLKRSFSRTKQT